MAQLKSQALLFSIMASARLQAVDNQQLGGTYRVQPPEPPGSSVVAVDGHVWAILGGAFANCRVKMALSECYIYGTRVK
jgi:hypothetical protein